nr:glu S.griseus protease inhibitor-like [Ipomoea batatas]GMD62848.1 glu S.griseus protease inhibitor-like [Ipomoea batatas]GMD72033.1 glu S.griseus protease inhibitor-like [Ipomoea batatas]
MSSICEGKESWPELVGEQALVAKTIIEKENPIVTAIISYPGCPRILNFRCDRVFVSVDCNNVVQTTPIIG